MAGEGKKRGWGGGSSQEVADSPQLRSTLSSVSSLHHCGGQIWKFGNLGPAGGRGGQRPRTSRGGDKRLPGLALAPALCTGAAPLILPARRKADSELSPQSQTGFPHKTPWRNPLLLILQMLSHDHLHQRSPPARLQGRPALPTTQPLGITPAPRPPTDHRPPAPRPQTTGPKDFRGPQGPPP